MKYRDKGEQQRDRQATTHVRNIDRYSSVVGNLKVFFDVMADDFPVGDTHIRKFDTHFASAAFTLPEMYDACVGTDDDDRVGEQEGQPEQLIRVEPAPSVKPHAGFAEIDNGTDFGNFRFRGVQRGGIYLDGDIGFNTGKFSAFL